MCSIGGAGRDCTGGGVRYGDCGLISCYLPHPIILSSTDQPLLMHHCHIYLTFILSVRSTNCYPHCHVLLICNYGGKGPVTVEGLALLAFCKEDRKWGNESSSHIRG